MPINHYEDYDDDFNTPTDTDSLEEALLGDDEIREQLEDIYGADEYEPLIEDALLILRGFGLINNANEEKLLTVDREKEEKVRHLLINILKLTESEYDDGDDAAQDIEGLLDELSEIVEAPPHPIEEIRDYLESIVSGGPIQPPANDNPKKSVEELMDEFDDDLSNDQEAAAAATAAMRDMQEDGMFEEKDGEEDDDDDLRMAA